MNPSRFAPVSLLCIALVACSDTHGPAAPPEGGPAPLPDVAHDSHASGGDSADAPEQPGTESPDVAPDVPASRDTGDAPGHPDVPDASLDGDATSDPDATSDRTRPGLDATICVGITGVPASHRAQPVACPTVRAPGQTTPNAMDQCTDDAACTAGPNGRCIYQTLINYRTCSYDQCSTDADCSGNAVCYCRPSETSVLPNICLYGNCRVDADCGSAGYCSLSKVPGGFNEFDGGSPFSTVYASGYFCRTANDCCVENADCAHNGTHFDYCLFHKHWMNWNCGGGP